MHAEMEIIPLSVAVVKIAEPHVWCWTRPSSTSVEAGLDFGLGRCTDDGPSTPAGSRAAAGPVALRDVPAGGPRR